MIRVIIDANVYLSYFASRDPESHLVVAMESSIASRNVDVLVPDGVIAEIRRIAESKEYFRRRISPEALERGIEMLVESSISLPPVEIKQAYSRDPADDYLIESALEFDAEYIVTGDKDLKILGNIGGVEVIPTEDYYWLLDLFDLLIGQRHHAPSTFSRWRLRSLGQ